MINGKITHGFEELEYLTPTVKELLKRRDTTYAEDDSFFLRIMPMEKRVAINNNFQALRFATGNVPELYKNMLKSKVVATIHEKLLAKMTNNVGIEGEDDESVGKIRKAIISFPKKINQAVSATLLRGECVLAISSYTHPKKGLKVTLQIYPLARYDLIVNQVDEIIEANLYKQLIDGENKYVKYVLAEHRYIKNDVCYSETVVTKYEFVRMSSNNEDMKITKLEKQDLPPSIVKVLDGLEINKPEVISTLGVYRLSNTFDNTLCPNSDVGESQYLKVIDDVISHDTTNTFKEIDKQIGRGRVLTPVIGKDIDRAINVRLDDTGKPIARRFNTFLDYTFISPYENYSGDKAVPQGIQFNLRTQEWLLDKNDSLSEICTKCGLSVYDYNPTLFNGVRTAREIDELSDLTRGTVKAKHSLLSPILDAMLKDIAVLLGYEDTAVFIKWDKSTTENAAANNEIVIARYNARLCSLSTAIKNLNPNWNSKEVEAEIERIDQETDQRDAAKEFGAI